MTATDETRQAAPSHDVSPTRGLTLNVYRAGGGDFTAGGISAHTDTLTLVGVLIEEHSGDRYVTLPDDSRVFAASTERPAVLLRIRTRGDKIPDLVPATWEGTRFVRAPGWHAAGGNYATTSDSRLADLLCEHLEYGGFYGALAIHDRVER